MKFKSIQETANAALTVLVLSAWLLSVDQVIQERYSVESETREAGEVRVIGVVVWAGIAILASVASAAVASNRLR